MDKNKFEQMMSNNVNNIEISGIRKFFNKVSKYKNAVSLTLGQPDFPVPKKVKEAMIEAINENKTTYTSNAGIEELRIEISRYLKSDSIEYKADEICLTIGGSEGLMDVFGALINSGDKVLIPTPAYPAYESCVKLFGGKVINYDLEKDFTIDIKNLSQLIDLEKPKVLVISYPCNPTGAILSKEKRDRIAELVKQKNIIVVTDEMYGSIIFDSEYYSIAQNRKIRDKVILVSGFSKMFSMTGLRLGYVCADENLMKGIMKVHQYNVSCAPSIVQWGALAGLKYCLQDAEDMCRELKKRRDYMYDRLIKMGIEVNLPQGAFYMFPKISSKFSSSEEFCEKMLQEALVAAVPGSAFGKGGEGYFRISYAYSMDQLKVCCDRMEEWLHSYR
jgi:aminotransferase